MKLSIRVLIPAFALTILAVGCSNPVGASMDDYVAGGANESSALDAVEETETGSAPEAEAETEADGLDATTAAEEPQNALEPVEKGDGSTDGEEVGDDATVGNGRGRGNGNAYGLENGNGKARGFEIGKGHDDFS